VVIQSLKFNFLISLCGLFLVAGCGQKQIRLVKTESLVVYENKDIRSAVQKIQLKNNVVKNIDYKNIDFFNHIQKKYATLQLNKALAIGYPSECGRSWHWWGASSQNIALEKALEGCLKKVQDLQPFTKEECGCRPAAVNDYLLVSPEELLFRKFQPVIIVLTEKGKDGEKQFVGLVQDDGYKIIVRSNKKDVLCKGTYKIKTVNGTFDLMCFDNAVRFKGEYKIKGYFSGRPYGVGKAYYKDLEAKFIFGLTDEEYKKILGKDS